MESSHSDFMQGWKPLIVATAIAGVPFSATAQTPPAADPADLYFQAYLHGKEAQECQSRSDFSKAIEKYRVSQKLLKQLRQSFPDWRREMVENRIRRNQENIDTILKESGSGAE